MAQETSRPTLQNIGNYDLIEKVAEGGMGTVYRGRHRDTGQIVAVKVVAPHMVGNQVYLKRFEQEYNAARQLNHPNIVRALEFDNTTSTPYMVMEFVEGESLGRKLEREGKLPEAVAKRLIIQVAQGLYKAHKEKLIHRDVKPDNILITPDGQAKLADLGLVKEVEADLNLTRTGRGLGTPNFMAPEQFRNAKNADERCDIYSLGATLYMMVTGVVPFKANGPLDSYMKKIENDLPPPRQLVPDLSERLDWAIQRAMSPDPETRPASCREFVEDLTGRTTRKAVVQDKTASGQQKIWYLVYQDEEGISHSVKGTAAGIRRSLKEGLLGDASNVRACRTKDGEFEPLRSFPEFRDLVIDPAPAGVAAVGGSSKAAAVATKTAPKVRNEEAPTVLGSSSITPRTAPHIPMKESSPSTGGRSLWLEGILLLAVALAAAIAGYFFIPGGR
jgi:serine/threonine protein kinase